MGLLLLILKSKGRGTGLLYEKKTRIITSEERQVATILCTFVLSGAVVVCMASTRRMREALPFLGPLVPI